MSTDRFRKLEEVYHSALGRPPESRDSFLAEACAGDEMLCEQVRSLLSNSEDDDFLREPEFGLGLRLLAEGAAASLAGSAVGPYRMLSLLGRGGMGDVYLADDPRLERRVALKLLQPRIVSDDRRVRRFLREARAASSISHPNVAHIYEVGEAGGRHYIAMEYVEGVTLRGRLRVGALTLKEAIDVAAQMAAALEAAHEAGIVHRDIKPENLMLRPDGYVKVLDFGVAKLAEPPLGEAAAAKTPTTIGLVVGTAAYMPPEQARGQDVDARADLWGLGAVLYEMVAGRPPFAGETAYHVIVSVFDSRPEPLASVAGRVPADLQRIVDRALAKEKGQRYQSAREMREDLEALKHAIERGAALRYVGRGTRLRRWGARRRAAAVARTLRRALAATPLMPYAAGAALIAILLGVAASYDLRPGLALAGIVVAPAAFIVSSALSYLSAPLRSKAGALLKVFGRGLAVLTLAASCLVAVGFVFKRPTALACAALDSAGLVGRWTGDDAARDSAGPAGGQLRGGAELTGGVVGRAYRFDGSDESFVDGGTPPMPFPPAGITLEAWVNTHELAAEQISSVVTKWVAAPAGAEVQGSYGLYVTNDDEGRTKLLGWLNTDAAGQTGIYGGVIRPGVWQHVAMTYDAASRINNLYVDGRLVQAGFNIGTLRPSPGVRVLVGREDSAGAPRPFKGMIDEVGVYGRALSPAEVGALYSAGRAGRCTTPGW